MPSTFESCYDEPGLHLPPGWGRVSYSKAIPHLKDYKALWILKVYERLRDHWSECLEVMERLFETKNGSNGC